MDSLEGARKAKADADASLKVSNDLVAAVEAKLQQLQDKFMEVSCLDWLRVAGSCFGPVIID